MTRRVFPLESELKVGYVSFHLAKRGLTNIIQRTVAERHFQRAGNSEVAGPRARIIRDYEKKK